MSAVDRFSLARAAQPRHFAAHSHHLWPDVTAQAHQQAWWDAVEHADHKWERVFAVVVSEAQAHIAGRLRLPDAATIAVAANTHELVTRLVSSLPNPARILMTDGEFHSMRRQAERWAEAGRAEVHVVPVEPFDSFVDRFVERAGRHAFDLIYVSHVMFDSGFVVPELPAVVEQLPSSAEVVIDGYHGFMALPTDLSLMADRIFYVAGGYKYAMAGEGACFMHCPSGRVLRPVDTGWYGGFAALEDASGGVGYASDGSRFLGATFDPAPWYRFNSVQRMLNRDGTTVEGIHDHVMALQERFLDGIGPSPALGRLIPARGTVPDRGHFLAFAGTDAERIEAALRGWGVMVDRRGDRLRIGFGIYHRTTDVDDLVGLVVSP
ncbi:MAG TPA: aminotransferase class V-fold PLP-dependent enzyme [Acidimicrobiia bacterium]|jgi:selenocysteine lyase/cysteine desulfurase|nr:aminotransferase class V-fold PLP-dependent enzyme [Acidimicrobiia bacterium]